ncbi:hypothetical protein [Micromonospora sp. SH-82]|uniref:hypothetical protein n=1 Tax=Micromonospora sp. SH-82 TaxID=3132938 RepID=UPI003EB83432
MEVGPNPPSGLLLELSSGSEAERWLIRADQSRALVHLSRRLVRRLDAASLRAA